MPPTQIYILNMGWNMTCGGSMLPAVKSNNIVELPRILYLVIANEAKAAKIKTHRTEGIRMMSVFNRY